VIKMRNLPVVTKSEIYDTITRGGEKVVVFDDEGLFSEVIWPQIDDYRHTGKAIIDLRNVGKIVHPKFLNMCKLHSKLTYGIIELFLELFINYS